MSAQIQTPTNGHTPTAPAFSEAPASINTLVTSPAGFSYQLTMRAARVGDLLSQARTLEAWLTENGWTPASKTPGKAQAQAQGDAANSVPSEPAPTCDKCGQPMIRRTTRDGSRSFWSCQTRFGSEWCKGKPKQ